MNTLTHGTNSMKNHFTLFSEKIKTLNSKSQKVLKSAIKALTIGESKK